MLIDRTTSSRSITNKWRRNITSLAQVCLDSERMIERRPGANQHDRKFRIRGRLRHRSGGGRWTFRQNEHRPALAYDAPHHRSIYKRMVTRSRRPRSQLRRGNFDDASNDGCADMDRWVGAPSLAARICLFATISAEHAETAAM